MKMTGEMLHGNRQSVGNQAVGGNIRGRGGLSGGLSYISNRRLGGMGSRVGQGGVCKREGAAAKGVVVSGSRGAAAREAL